VTDDQPQLLLRPDGLPTVGLAIIAKNEEETLPRLLDSLGWTADVPADAQEVAMPEVAAEHRRWTPVEGAAGLWRPDAQIDFVVVADTGSTDGTIKLARERGCRVVSVPWTDDFSAARQVSYDVLPEALAFTLWADCDDLIEGGDKLRNLAAMMPAEVSGTLHRYDYARDDAGNCICELWRERLVRNNIGATWMLPIHEVLQVPTSLMHVGEVVWHHHQPADRERDPERNYKILRRSFEASTAAGEDPDSRTIAYLGTEALGLGRPDEASQLFRLYLGRKDIKNTEERCQVSHKLSIALRAIPEGEKEVPAAQLEESMEAAMLAIHERPDWPDGYIDLAEISLRREEPERALAFCEQAMARETPKTLLIINPLEYQYQPLLMKSVALAKLGRVEEAVQATQEALAITPYREDLQQQAALVGEQLKRQRATEAFLALREALVRHDENWKAQQLMECAPYFIWNDPAVSQARLDQREMTLHAIEPDVYGSYYRENPNEAPFEHTGIPIEEAHERFHRVQFLRDGLAEQAKADGRRTESLAVLDLSANDGWMLANLASGGFGSEGQLDGMDLNRDASERAGQRLEDRGITGRVVCADLHTAPEHFEEGGYDAVVLFETLEHVPDPAATLDVLRRMVKPGGRMYVSTPHGAYENGNVPGWAVVESKGHLRAMQPSDVAGLLVERGKITAMTSEQRLIVASAEPRERRGKVIFYAGPADSRPEQIVETGLGGSETAMCKMAEHFARRGYVVKVYSGEGGGVRQDHLTVEGEHDEGEVLYEPGTAWNPGERCDLFVSLRIPEAFDRTINCDTRLLWLHDADYGDRLTEQRVSRATHVAVLSEFHRDLMVEKYPFVEDKIFLTRNGIETSLYTGPEAQRKPWLVYSSSPDRGLDVLLECWPTIRRQAEAAGVKKPQLHYTYSPIYKQFRDSGAFPHLQAFHSKIERLVAEDGEGLVDHDHLSQPALAALFREAMIWSYPSWSGTAPFPEISCIGAMEAQAGGCIPVCLEYGALTETVAAGRLIPPLETGGKLNSEWRERFIEAIVLYLTDREQRSEIRSVAQPAALELDWSGVCDQWQLELLTKESVPA
jgi:2-polyprenyl-3-methyl-5-hydroxy-6-metoxy-1,4-benzoquinol methylase/glycosyltransferase involved in cell wall biosynthesis